jgi:nucleoside-diphosphate-sugar epimerase
MARYRNLLHIYRRLFTLTDPYSLSKLVNEETCAAFHRAYGITTAAFRFAGVWHDKMYRERIAEGLPLTTEWSDLLYQWVHVKDLVHGLRQALEAPELPGHGVYA